VPNGVDDRFRAPLAASEVDRRLAALGLASGYLLFVGNPKPHKNLPLLLEAHRRLAVRRAARAATVPVLVLAGGELEAPTPLAVPAASPAVRRLGVVAEADLPALYRGAFALVVPSLWEGFGLPALEAMAGGTPVIAAARGALPEVVGDDALLFDPDDVDQLVDQIERLLDDAALAGDLARRGPLRAARYSWRETARATLAVYREVLADRGRSAR
jgi:alpha-1,3-rhamnosyl/mannosyltransferase